METVERFVKINSGYGSGDGSGDGSGSGDGYGYGDGSGYGYGDGIKSFCGQSVKMIDNMLTLIDHIRGNIARGSILQSDFTTTPCYIVKNGNLFAHGETLREAMDSLNEKLFNNMPIEQRIVKFKEHFTGKDKYPALEFFEWHGKLTGSCEMGRKSFARDHEIDLDKDKITVAEFIDLTKDSYGGEVIRQTEAAIKSTER